MASSPSEDENLSLDVAVHDEATQYFYNRRVIPAWTRAHDKFERSMHAVIDAFLDRRVVLDEAEDFREGERIRSEWRFDVSLADVYLASGLDNPKTRTAKRQVEAEERAAEFWLEYSRDVKALEDDGLGII